MFVWNIFLYNCQDYLSLSSNFYHQGENNQFNQILMCHDYLSLSSNIYHREINSNGSTLPVSQLEQGRARRHWSSSIIFMYWLVKLQAQLQGRVWVSDWSYICIKILNLVCCSRGGCLRYVSNFAINNIQIWRFLMGYLILHPVDSWVINALPSFCHLFVTCKANQTSWRVIRKCKVAETKQGTIPWH